MPYRSAAIQFESPREGSRTLGPKGVAHESPQKEGKRDAQHVHSGQAIGDEQGI